MGDRSCVRGCTVQGVHFAACPSFDADGGTCTGCAPRASADLSMICDRCAGKLKRTLEAAPDVLALIRSQADPLKAAVYDREMVSGGNRDSAPAPVPSDLIDASDDLIRILRKWAGESTAHGLEPGADAEAAHDEALGLVDVILGELAGWLNDRDGILEMCGEVIDMPPIEYPEAWTVARAMRRWPLEDRAFWAAQPCPLPSCGLRAVKVTPPRRHRGDTRYRCTACEWEASDRDDDGFWSAVFSRKQGASA